MLPDCERMAFKADYFYPEALKSCNRQNYPNIDKIKGLIHCVSTDHHLKTNLKMNKEGYIET